LVELATVVTAHTAVRDGSCLGIQVAPSEMNGCSG